MNRNAALSRLLSSFAMKSRQIGKTRSAADLVRRVGGILVTFNTASARQIGRDFDIDTVSVQGFTGDGIAKPIVFDQDALVYECGRLLNELKETEEALHNTQQKLKQLRDILNT